MATTSSLLAPGTKIEPVNTRLPFWVGKCLGEGSQGAVFTVKNKQGNQYALKWYHPATATREQWIALKYLLDQDPPHERFIWPIDLARAAGKPNFGYIMPLRKPGFVGMADLVANRIEVSLRETATIGLELAESFLILHSRGLCYRDVNFGNVFLNPNTGSVLICDVDNIGINERSESQILGTPYFMAPEILRGDALPSTKSDQFSLAILLFFLFVGHHPLEGRRALGQEIWDAEAQIKVFGKRPIFIFDDEDSSNRPVAGYQDTPLQLWPIYPQFLRDHFIQSFTEGLRDPVNGRVGDSVWRSDMVRLRESIFYCESCHKQNFYDSASEPKACWSCGHRMQLPYRLRIVRAGRKWESAREIMLNSDTSIYAHHLYQDYDFKTKVAEVVRHPVAPNLWGIKNLGPLTWSATHRDGTIHSGPPGKTLSIIDGVKLTLGPLEAEIVAP